MFFIDIAVPRDVDPEVNKLDGIFLYDIDDLQSVAGSHLKERSREAELAEAMILAEVDKYQRRLHALNVAPEIVQLQQSAEQIRLGELRRAGKPPSGPFCGTANGGRSVDPEPGEQVSPSTGAGHQGCCQRGECGRGGGHQGSLRNQCDPACLKCEDEDDPF